MNASSELTNKWRAAAIFRAFSDVVVADYDNGGSVQKCWVPRHAADQTTGKIIANRNTYKKLRICGRSHQAHDVVLSLINNRLIETEIGEIGMHFCNNPACRNPLHLKPGNQVENMRYAVACGRTAKAARNGHITCPGRTPRGDTHPHSQLKGARRQTAVELLKKYQNQRGHPKAISDYLNVSRYTIYNLKRTKAHLGADVGITDIELKFQRWVRGAKRNRNMPRTELEKVIQIIRQRFHETPDHERTGMRMELAEGYGYSSAWILKILKRNVYDDIATDIPKPEFFGIGSRNHGKIKTGEEMK